MKHTHQWLFMGMTDKGETALRVECEAYALFVCSCGKIKFIDLKRKAGEIHDV